MSFCGPGGKPITQAEHEARWKRPPAAHTAPTRRPTPRWAWVAAVVAALGVVAAMSLDAMEAVAKALTGLAISMVAVWLLRASGAWVTAPAWVIAALFFGLSLGRSRALRAIFRRAERAR
jgi:hypothetical protein